MFRVFRGDMFLGDAATMGEATALCNEDNKKGWVDH